MNYIVKSILVSAFLTLIIFINSLMAMVNYSNKNMIFYSLNIAFLVIGNLIIYFVCLKYFKVNQGINFVGNK